LPTVEISLPRVPVSLCEKVIITVINQQIDANKGL
jgi:hypothetical protein